MAQGQKESPVIRLHPSDNVAVARQAISAGTAIPAWGIAARTDIPPGHKIAVLEIAQGGPVLKGNTVIGRAGEKILPGSHVHTHNLQFSAVEKELHFCTGYQPVEILPEERQRTFQGFLRPDRQAGTRNCIAVVICSNCAATVARKIAAHFTEDVLRAYPQVDAVTPLIHHTGCGLEKSGTPLTLLRRLLAGCIRNPNFAGAVVCALGCETNQIDAFFEETGLVPGRMLRRLVIQEAGGSRKAVRRGIQMVEEMLPAANQAVRQTLPARYLKLGLECGGSDAFSGLSANPALGRAVDRLVEQGGTAVFTEPTELLGMEAALVRRARSPEVAERMVSVMNWWVAYSRGRDSQICGRVAPGNNAGGLSNVLEKALGSAQKSGSTPLNEVVDYAEPVAGPGVVFMNAPSFDPLSSAAMFAGGCNLCAFTTGRGSCYGSLYMPTLKIASNTPLYVRQEDDMDWNAGTVIDGVQSLEEAGQAIFEELLQVASGKKTKSERFGMGSDEFVVWGRGITS